MRKHLLILFSILAGGVVAQDPCEGLVVDFTFAPDQNGIAFTDGSEIVGAITWYQWTFGDGNISFVQNPVHQFEVSGSYEVCLTIGTSIETPEGPIECLDSTCHIVEYNSGGFSCDQYEASFTAEFVEGTTMVFFSTTDPPGGNQFWQFGDGNSGSGQQFTHTFDTTGTFTVCLVSSIWNSSTEEFCNDAICLPVIVGDTLDCENLVPSFSGTVIGGNTILFEQTTDPPAIAYSWNFGDNSVGSGPIVEHTFASPGTYQVCLGAGWWNEVAQDTCWNSTCDLFYLVGPEDCDPELQIGFGWSQSAGLVSFFADGSVEAGGYFWDFGDGSGATGANVEHQFVPGEHFVCLESWYLPNELSDTCWTTFCDTIMAGSGTTDCSSMALSFSVTEIAEGLQLTNTSEIPGLPISIEWNFGDGASGSGNEVVHAYNAIGDYEVCLTITSVIGPISDPDTCISTFCDTVTWNGLDPCLGLEATFIGAESGPLQWTFEHTTDPPAQGFFWDFGDGSAGTGGSVQHQFGTPGNYEVCLTTWWWNEAIQDSCFSTTCEFFTVTGEAECDPGFGVDLTWEQNANQFTFVATTNNAEAQIIWDFGDGTTGAGDQVAHLFEPPGPYTVCAIAWYWNGSTQDTCWAEICQEVEWSTGGCDPEFGVQISAEPIGNTVTFIASPSLPAIGHIWNFGDGSTAAGETVMHTFEPPGPYEVCVSSWYWEEASADTCWADACITVDPFLGIDEVENSAGIVIFPQPANELITIDARTTSAIPSEALLFSSDGRSVGTFPINRLPHSMNVSDLAAGVYVLQLKFEDRLLQRRIVIE